jgi:glycosyltransferase involved in cell wall biosynthesis
MSCGLPVLVSDAPGPAEIVSDGLDGFVVPRENVTVAANKMVGLVIDEELRKCMGKEGRAKVLRQYDWDKNVKQMMSVYEEHISHSKN